MMEREILDYKRLSEEMKQLLTWWIGEYIRPAKYWNHRISSYRLKHMFEEVVHKYVSNGQFKMAMLKAGYCPYNPEELNWHFKICKVDLRSKNMSFYDWCISEYINQDNVAGDLARSIHVDKDFPKSIVKKRAILNYLRQRKSSEAVIITFYRVWDRYEAEVSIRVEGAVRYEYSGFDD